jgi:hypothetical protein
MKLTITLFKPAYKRCDYATEIVIDGKKIKYRGKVSRHAPIDYTEDIHDRFVEKLTDCGGTHEIELLREQTIITYEQAMPMFIHFVYNKRHHIKNMNDAEKKHRYDWERILKLCIIAHGILVFSNNKKRYKYNDNTAES